MSIEHITTQVLQHRKLLLWIGAGTSYSAGIPTDAADNTGLAHQLATIHYNNAGLAENALGNSFDLAQLAATIGKDRVRQLILQQGWMDLPVAVAHRAIAALIAEGFHLEVVTVNYDPLLENAIKLEGIVPHCIHSAATVVHLSEDTCPVIKIHGCPYCDPIAANLLMLENELEHPPQWVINYLNGRLQERIFVYSGFSGNVAYVRQSIADTRESLNGQLNDAHGVDRLEMAQVYSNGNALGEFYRECGVPEPNYVGGGADEFFRSLANTVFRRVATSALELATNDANHHCHTDGEPLRTIIDAMEYQAIREFVRKAGCLNNTQVCRLADIELRSIFKWMLILIARNIVEPGSFRPVLAFPYHAGPTGLASAPIIFIDGRRQEITTCQKQLEEAAGFRTACQVAAEPRWYVIIVNVVGNADSASLDIIYRDGDTTIASFDPAIVLDENTLTNNIQHVEDMFQL